MQYRHLGKSGLKVSAVGLGCNQFGGKVDRQGTIGVVNRALELGVNFFDTANVYSQGRSEEFLGEALKGRWDQAVLATKFRSSMGEGPNDKGASRYHLMRAVEDSLRRLQRDHIDLLQVHSWDPETPLEETMRALDDLVRSGKVRYIGASNFLAWQLCRANAIAEMRGWTAFVSVQSHYHLLERGIERELIPYCSDANIGVLPYFPLAGGFLTGKYQEGQPPPAGTRGETSPYVQRYLTAQNFARLERLCSWAEDRGHTVAELAIAWLLSRPQLSSVIAGATHPAQIEANVRAAEWQLSPAEQDELRVILEESSEP